MKVVAQGFDKADEYIAERCTDGDLIITADIPREMTPFNGVPRW